MFNVYSHHRVEYNSAERSAEIITNENGKDEVPFLFQDYQITIIKL